MHVNDLLKIAVEHGASDLHLKVGSYPMMRVRGQLVPAIEDKRLDHEDVVAMSAAVMSTGQRQKFKDAQEVDLAYSVAGLGRFRCNVFQQRGTVGLVLRVIPSSSSSVAPRRMMCVRINSLGWRRAASWPTSTSEVWKSRMYVGQVALSVGLGAVRGSGYTSWTSTSAPAAARTRFSLGFVSPEITTLRPGASMRYPYASRQVPCSTTNAVTRTPPES